ncbi:MAG: hypothetical protein COB97_04125 [Paracoccus sp.]|nr:MAG: hypothetical protein COB97_04125 [Paracoccus sp. (in: a-proteobacteria)]
MGKFLIGVVGLVAGLVIGAFVGLNFGGGAMMGAGVATGFSAGMCSTLQAAQEEGLLTPRQVDQLLDRAARDVAGLASIQPGETIVGGTAECAVVLDQLKAAAGQ